MGSRGISTYNPSSLEVTNQVSHSCQIIMFSVKKVVGFESYKNI